MGGQGRLPSRTNMLQQRADQRRRDEDDIVEMRQLLAEFSGVEIDDQFMETFSRGLAEETGALPPPRIVVEAIKEAKSAEPRNIADAVRAYYRRPRPRPANAPQQAQAPMVGAAVAAEPVAAAEPDAQQSPEPVAAEPVAAEPVAAEPDAQQPPEPESALPTPA
jgi:hypothetical protein